MTTTFDIASQTNLGIVSNTGRAPAISGDGNIVTFLAYDPVSTKTQVYAKNELTSALTLISASTGGVTGSNTAYLPTISADGSTIGFDSFASNPVANATGVVDEVFVKTLATGGLVLVSQTAAGVAADAISENVALSANGNIAAFDSAATNFGLGAPGTYKEIYTKNLTTGALTLVSQTSTGTVANANTQSDDISADGNIVIFETAATDLGSGSGSTEIYSKNIQTGALQIVSQTAVGVLANSGSYGGSASADGTLVAFYSAASNLVSGATAGNYEAYVKNLTTGALSLISSSSSGVIANGQSTAPIISADGRYALFSSTATNLVPNATSGVQQVYVKDLVTGQLTLLSQDASGVAGTAASSTGSLSEAGFSADDSRITFSTLATNLGATAGNSTVLRATTTGPAVNPGAVAGDNIVSGSELTAATFSGTSDAIGGTVQVAIDTAANVVGSATVAADGTWSLTANVNSLSEGAHTELASAQGSGYLATTATKAFQVDTSGPTLAFSPGVTFKSATVATVRGTVSDPTSAITKVDVFDNGVSLGAATLNGDGTWTLANVSLPLGVQALAATATNANGNTSALTPSLNYLETGIHGQPYADYEADLDASGNLTGETFTKKGGRVYLADTATTRPNGDVDIDYTTGSFFNSQTFNRREDLFSSSYAVKVETLYNNDGSHSIEIDANKQTVQALGSDTFNDNASKTRFVFDHGVGQEVINGFTVAGPGHDIVSLPDSAAGRLAQILAHAQGDGQGDTTIKIGQGDTITFAGVSVNALKNHAGDFVFHA